MNRVLLVDDDPVLQELIAVGLESEGYEVQCVADGVQAQQAVNGMHFDAIVLDLLMPVMDGVRFAHWLRKEEGLRTPVLVLSAMVTEQKASELSAYDNVDFLLKPAGLEEVLGKLNALIRKQ